VIAPDAQVAKKYSFRVLKKSKVFSRLWVERDLTDWALDSPGGASLKKILELDETGLSGARIGNHGITWYVLS
jgi:hypothetical protein